MNRFVVAFLDFYQDIISPFLGNRCRFYPSCSQYAILCFQRFSFFKAFYRTVIRLLKCSSFHSGGVDIP